MRVNTLIDFYLEKTSGLYYLDKEKRMKDYIEKHPTGFFSAPSRHAAKSWLARHKTDLEKSRHLEKTAFIPLVSAGLGAIGGALTAPKGHRLAGALTGGAFGAITGVGGFRNAFNAGKLLLNKGMQSGARAGMQSASQYLGQRAMPTMSKALGGTMRDIGGTAMLTGAMGGYN